MSELTLDKAQKILTDTLADARTKGFKPMAVAVLDARGALVSFAAEDGSSAARWKVALGKAQGTIALGIGSRKIGTMAVERPHFIGALNHLVAEGIVPVAGGVLIKDAQGKIIGAVGVSGDTSDNDELMAVEAIKAAGFTADGG
ncbi:GlcG/HbpS family heme-binding protein [Methylovirgula sp. 4M-Z18]|uniref:GlcG/HbpS family heme-binding protein n=1 Tax=Methylovirgula sp. 4M-Z18 TaxID=2293567 RepID=UPI000E2F781C|nr:heme-binding protein [Methylovirgula sp. 4M-Z18]RFB80273.1 heme-binding protein [Methylovirgula sp. 4M-Z18]